MILFTGQILVFTSSTIGKKVKYVYWSLKLKVNEYTYIVHF